MKKQVHILNGEALKDRFPTDISGDIIVARECLVDGSVKGDNLKELFSCRARFISNHYDGYTELDYYKKTVPEFDRILSIKDGRDINLWFEDDLFCQVNFWFVINLLRKSKNLIFLVRPKNFNRYGFGGLTKSALKSIYIERQYLNQIDKLSKLWVYYQKAELNKLVKTARDVETSFPFILKAVDAHLERIPKGGKFGRPTEALIQIMDDLETTEFGPVFSEFSIKEAIYGFGDLQVKRLLDKISGLNA